MSIKGFKSQQALQQKLNGYTEDQSIDRARYVTVQEMNGKRHALDVLIHGAYQVTVAPKTIEAGSNIRTLKITNHGANENDIIRLSDGTQFSALSVPDANTIITSVELDSSPVGDTCTIWRHITPSYNADGSLNVLSSQGPIQFNKDGTPTTVNYVTGTPSSSDALPVNIVTVNGQGIATTVDLSGAQINVQLTDRGTSPDAVRIGDGVDYLAVNADGSINATVNTITGFATETTLGQIKTIQTDGSQKTKITDGAGVVNTKQIGTAIVGTDVGLITQSLIHGLSTGGGGTYVDVKVSPSGALQVEATSNGANLATAANQVTANASLSSIDTKLSSQATAANQTSTNTKLDTLIAKDFATSAKQDAEAVLIGAVNETAPASDTASSGLNGRLQRIAQRLTSLIGLLPASLGAKTSAASLSVVPASDAVFSTKPKALTNSYAEFLTLTTIQTFTAPANAIGGKIMAQDTNTANVRYKQNGTATTTSGMQLQAGRAEDFTGGSDITVVSESGTQAVFIQWTIQA